MPTALEIERRKRIRATLAAYAYEFESHSIMTDTEFDKLCLSIEPEIRTGKRVLDLFFKTSFSPYTGQWIHDHPELEKVKACYDRVYKQGSNREDKETDHN